MARGGTGPVNGLPPGVRPLTTGDPVIIGRYPLLGRLGVGGMGVVYLAEHPRGGVVALKTPHPLHLHDATLRTRFAEEVEFSRRVIPFCTAAVIEDGVDGGQPYLVSEYIPGPELSQVMAARGPLPPGLAYGVALGVAAAMMAVHEAGLVHRDLKPANVLLSDAGPRLIDFGIARDVDALVAHTRAGHVMGSPGWVAPERLTGDPALPPSDIFSWGCLVAYAATGHHPFGTGELDVLTRRILLEPPHVVSVPPLLRPAVEASLAKDPTLRPEAADLLRALLAAGGVGNPRDLRQAVADVLAKIWTPVPHPPETGEAGLAVPSVPVSGRYPAPFPAPLPGSASAKRSRRTPRRGVHLSQASFAALATVSMAAVTVVAAANGGVGGDTGPGTPSRAPTVAPTPETTGGSPFRGPLPPAGGRRTASPVVAPSITPGAVRNPPPRTVPLPPVNGEHEEPQPAHPQGPGGRSREDDPRTCADAMTKGNEGKGCPPAPGDPRPSFPRVPQNGEGESPALSSAPSSAVTGPQLPPGVDPPSQPDD